MASGFQADLSFPLSRLMQEPACSAAISRQFSGLSLLWPTLPHQSPGCGFHPPPPNSRNDLISADALALHRTWSRRGAGRPSRPHSWHGRTRSACSESGRGGTRSAESQPGHWGTELSTLDFDMATPTTPFVPTILLFCRWGPKIGVVRR